MTAVSWLRVAADPAVRVASLPLACCALEVESAVRLGLLRPETEADGPAERAVLLVAGTVTRPLADILRSAAAELPADTRIVAFGACATSGGPYWDAPSVEPGAADTLAVDGFVPGCPPTPTALVEALAERTAIS